MRIKTLDDLNALGLKARQAVTESLLKSGATLSGSKNVRHTKSKALISKQENTPSKKKTTRRLELKGTSMVMRSAHGLLPILLLRFISFSKKNTDATQMEVCLSLK